MKTLFVGVYREGTGWGQAGINMLRSLARVGVDVVARPHILGKNVTPPEDILALEAKSAAGCEVVIQHTLPHCMDYSGHFKKNIAAYCTETSEFSSSSWADRLNVMDEAWVPNRQMVDAARKSGVTVPMKVVHYGCDLERYNQVGNEPLPLLKPYVDRGDFLFYFVGEFVRRKNIEALVKAFHLEFRPEESVQLVLKTGVPGKSPEQSRQAVEQLCHHVKLGLKLHGGKVAEYKQEVIVTDRLTEQGLLKLHKTCHCFVMPSCGEAWCIPAFDAMAMGRTPIVPRSTGFVEYVSPDVGWLVDAIEAPVTGAIDTFADLCVGTETWWPVDVLVLRRAMREAFEQDSKRRQEMAANGIDKAFNYSYTTVGLQMAQLLTRP